MSDEGKALTADHIFKKIIWRHTMLLCHAMEQATTWSITGIATIIGLFISNLDSVGSLVNSKGLKWFLITFTASLVFGAVSKHVGMALGKGLEIKENIEELLCSEQGQMLICKVSTPPKEFIKEIAEPFFWPFSSFMRAAGLNGITDYLAGDKRFSQIVLHTIGVNLFTLDHSHSRIIDPSIFN